MPDKEIDESLVDIVDTGLDFENDLKIDKFNLDDEWVDHSDLVRRYGEEAARQDKILADMQIDLKVKTAETSLKYRLNPGEGYKSTDSTVKELTANDPGVIELQRAVARQQSVVDHCNAAVVAFQNRKHALIKISDLILSGYGVGESYGGKSSTPKSQRNQEHTPGSALRK